MNRPHLQTTDRLHVAIVVADPRTDSFCHDLADRAATALAGAGHLTEPIDLHRRGFRAAMSAEERRAYHTDDPIVDPIVAEHARVVTSVDVLVVVYPTVVGGLPAILKGWLERVFVPGVAFVFDEHDKVRPALQNLRTVIGISVYDEPRWRVWLRNDNGRRTFTRALKLSSGWRTRTRWRGLYGFGSAGTTTRAEFTARIEREMGALR
jgi:NAD(P)H dehydrogenase (quinone)